MSSGGIIYFELELRCRATDACVNEMFILVPRDFCAGAPRANAEFNSECTRKIFNICRGRDCLFRSWRFAYGRRKWKVMLSSKVRTDPNRCMSSFCMGNHPRDLNCTARVKTRVTGGVGGLFTMKYAVEC